ncbi:hypothetical protein B0J15DRAFT_557789 [Fusarium solani]|uniref:Uncharacterized protein n=1 Tax=Fusarium solani TaxID=169388 RepID=A0A9P9L6F0_FUSSL|nr:uncharacterized protein B0J15DRAFT_557789 [Fusarium solani]KAH7275715.1 hypothetical protein B0J15DRAFT_557789 [Fusarium solani]
MSSKLMAYWGLACPVGGRFYICEESEEQFMGCCTSDPCAKGNGVCPDKDLRTATFDRGRNAKIPMQGCGSSEDPEERPKHAAEVNPITEVHTERRLLPGRLHPLDIVLTFIPTCFIALALVSVHLDEQPLSDFGERVVELTRLSPTIYPILFAAVSSRFYKAFARWLSIIGSGILLIWAMSPLGGQSASRLLAPGNSTTISDIVIYFSDPGSQFSAFPAWASFNNKQRSITALYSSALMSSQQQKGSVRDLWELPKIPQWSPERKMDEWYDVEEDAFSRGDSHYASLLGIKIQGLDSSSTDRQYDFTVMSSYMDFKCVYAGRGEDDGAGPFSIDMKTPWRNVLALEAWERWKSRDDLPPVQLTYTSVGEELADGGETSSFSLKVNCTLQTITVETAIRCGPRPLATSCFARRQRRVKGKHDPNRPPEPILSNFLLLQRVMEYWPLASGEGDGDGDLASPTENYIMGDPHPFAGQPYRAWTKEDLSIFPDAFSRHFTTTFNTYWDSALNPSSHANVSFTSTPAFNILSYGDNGDNIQPFMNSASGTRTAVHRLVLQFFIRGPDVLGFASSLTRDNPYTEQGSCEICGSNSRMCGLRARRDISRFERCRQLRMRTSKNPRWSGGHLTGRSCMLEGQRGMNQ